MRKNVKTKKKFEMEKYLCKILRIYDTNMTTNIKNLPNISAYNIEPHHRKYVHCNETKNVHFKQVQNG